MQSYYPNDRDDTIDVKEQIIAKGTLYCKLSVFLVFKTNSQ